MNRQELLQAVDQEVSALLPEAPRPEQKAVAGLVVGVVSAEQTHLSRASAAIPGPAQDRSKLRRSQRLLANPRLDVARAQRRLVRRVLAQRRGRLDLLLDATTTSATAHDGGTVTLCFAVAWHGRAIPVLWRTWSAGTRGQDWRGTLREMTQTLHDLLTQEAPDGAPLPAVVLLADRGLSGSTLARLAQERGWHYLLRVIRTTQVTTGAAATAATPPERQPRRAGTGAWRPQRLSERRPPLSPAPQAAARGGRLADVLGCRAHRPGGRRLAGSGRGSVAVGHRSARRHRALHRVSPPHLGGGVVPRPQRDGLALEPEPRALSRARRTSAPRVGAGNPLDAGAGPAHPAARPARPAGVLLEERTRRCYSVFQLGLRWLRRCLTNDQPVQVTFTLLPLTFAPCPKLS